MLRHSADTWVIIPEAQWLEVQAGVARNARHVTAPTFVSGPAMLAGIAGRGYPECGNAPTIAAGKEGRDRYYRCSRNLRRGETARRGASIRDENLETVVADTLAERVLRPDRLQQLLANLPDDSSTAMRGRQAHLKALRTERTRVKGAIQNMFDFTEQDIVSLARCRLHQPGRQPAGASRRMWCPEEDFTDTLLSY